jgi:hypothetical protein
MLDATRPGKAAAAVEFSGQEGRRHEGMEQYPSIFLSPRIVPGTTIANESRANAIPMV